VRLCFLSTTKIEQKIDTGGIKSTNTPMLKFLMNFALFELDSTARHIEHCAAASACSAIMSSNATTAMAMYLSFRIAPITVQASA
jgi:hypothetical protein